MSDDSLKALIAIIQQGRQEDREDLKVMREEMSTMAKSVNELTNTMTAFVSDTRHINKELEDIKEELHGKGGIVERVGTLEISQAEDARNWLFLSSVAVVVFSGIVGYYFTIVKPVQSANVNNEEVKVLIQRIEEKLK
jgi:hypothetical protein